MAKIYVVLIMNDYRKKDQIPPVIWGEVVSIFKEMVVSNEITIEEYKTYVGEDYVEEN